MSRALKSDYTEKIKVQIILTGYSVMLVDFFSFCANVFSAPSTHVPNIPSPFERDKKDLDHIFELLTVQNTAQYKKFKLQYYEL